MSSSVSNPPFAAQPADLTAGQRAGLAVAVVVTHLALGWAWWQAKSVHEVVEAGEVVEVSLITDQQSESRVATEAPQPRTEPEPFRAIAKPLAPQQVRPLTPAQAVVQQATQTPPVMTSQTGAESVAAATSPVATTAATTAASTQAAPATAQAPAPPPPPKEFHVSAVSYLVPPVKRYPRTSFDLGEQGTAMLRVLVDEQGRPIDIQVAASSGYPRLDQQALQAMRAARFKPYQEDGVPRRMWVRAPFVYSIEDN